MLLGTISGSLEVIQTFHRVSTPNNVSQITEQLMYIF